ncbi:MAG: sensor histidine kinase, partial [Bauldia sp.]|nr:sensor histidine kinase [Bauldia sp.]
MAAGSSPYSLRRRLLLWLLIPLVLIGVLALSDANRSARALADQVSDRVLAGSAQAIGERVVVGDDGNLEVDVPYVALDMLTSAAQDRVFYRIDGPSGAFITGYQGLPAPAGGYDQQAGMSFHDAVFRDAEIRFVVLNSSASSGQNSVPFRVTVAETTKARRQLADEILMRSAIRQGLIILSAAIIVWLAVTRGLRPLHRLEEAIGRRSPDDLRPIEQRVPREVGGLVSTINDFMARLGGAIQALRHFTGNASHQLRTPLAIIRTQLALSTRAATPDESQAAIDAADRAVAHIERVLSQLLLLARVDEAASDKLTGRTTDLSALARNVTQEYVRPAADLGVDLGFATEG